MKKVKAKVYMWLLTRNLLNVNAKKMSTGDCEMRKSKEQKVTQRGRINCTEEDDDIIQKNAKNREYISEIRKLMKS